MSGLIDIFIFSPCALMGAGFFILGFWILKLSSYLWYHSTLSVYGWSLFRVVAILLEQIALCYGEKTFHLFNSYNGRQIQNNLFSVCGCSCSTRSRRMPFLVILSPSLSLLFLCCVPGLVSLHYSRLFYICLFIWQLN